MSGGNVFFLNASLKVEKCADWSKNIERIKFERKKSTMRNTKKHKNTI